MLRTIRRCLPAAATLLFALLAPEVSAARKEALALQLTRLRLPGAPAAVIPADLDADGRSDLVVVLAFTELESTSIDRVEGLVQLMTVIPALYDRREARAYRATGNGSYELVGEPLSLPRSVLSLASGIAGQPIVALTDEGLSALRFDAARTPVLRLEPILADPPVIAGSGNFVSDLEWVRDLDGDGRLDVLLPSRQGPAVYLGTATGLDSRPRQRLRMPGDRQDVGRGAAREYPLPRVEDVNGDGHPDLIVEEEASDVPPRHLFIGRGDGTFEAAYPQGTCERAQSLLRHRLADLVYLGDLNGDGRAEGVTVTEIEPGKDGFLAGMKQAKKPRMSYGVHRLGEDLVLAGEPAQQFEVLGHAGFNVGPASVGMFRDLDADGKRDLVTVTLDFSVLGALKVLATHRISIGFDFHVWAQKEGGRFVEVKNLDLSEKLTLDLDDLSLQRMAQFAGDFDGDGRIDFVHLGRGRKLTIHRGAPGCVYPVDPDLVIELEREPQDLGLVQVRDLDGDGRADLAITRLLPETDVSAPVDLELYLSGGSR